MSDLKDIVILGAGGLGREIVALVEACNAQRKEWNILGFLDPNPDLAGSEVNGYRVLGNDEWQPDDSVWFVCGIGDPRVRFRTVKKFSARGSRFASLIHPDVAIPKSVRIGAGTVVMAGTRFTVDAKIGDHVTVYVNCSITHDVEIADFCMVAPGCNLSGGVVLEEGAQLGTGVSVLPRRRIGPWATIGAGSVVNRDIPGSSTAVGVPCRPITRS
jgi:sugar O-acyltransferase (sialic acid O-acetyltransferase NeuD family)